MIHRFENFELDDGLYTLRRDGERVEIQPKVLDLLLYLVQHRDRIVPKDELLAEVWSGVVVNEEALSRAVHAARAALGDDGERQAMIQTQRRRGFRFTAEVLEARPSPLPAPVVGAPPRVPLIGRQPVLQRLRAAIDDAAAGHGRLILIGGEAGLGKTRIAEETALLAAASGARVSTAWCYEGAGAPSYWPWVQILRAIVSEGDPAALREHFGAGAGDVAQIVPQLRDKLPELPEPEELLPEQARFRLFDTVNSYFKRATAVEPHVLIVDDLHWADAASLLLIEFVANEIGTARLLIVGTYREDEVGAEHPLTGTLARVIRHSACERMFLDGLSESEVAQFVALSSDLEPAPGLVGAVLEKTGGNPFLITEIVQLLEEEAAPPGADGERSFEIALPRGVKEVLGRRLAALSEETRSALVVASVIGTEFGLDAVERVWRGGPELALECLEEAVAARILTEVEGAIGRYRFVHGLIRETLYEGLGAERKARLHRRVGEALETSHDPDARSAELATHFIKAANAADAEKAIRYATRAGESASSQMAYEEASEYFGKALDALELRVSATERQRCELLLAQGEAQRRAGESVAARETFIGAVEVARKLAAPDLLSRAALDIGGPFSPFEVGVVDDLEVQLLEEALAVLPEEDGVGRARLLARLSLALYWSQDARSLVLSDAAADVARRVGEPAALANALGAKLLAMVGAETIDERLPVADDMVRHAVASGNRELIASCRVRRLMELLESGAIERVDAELGAIVKLAEELRQPLAMWYASTSQATKALIEGRYAECQILANRAREQGERLDNPNVLGAYQMQMTLLHRDLGKLRLLENEIKGFVAHKPDVAFLRASLMSLYREVGDEKSATREYERLVARDPSEFGGSMGWTLTLALLAEEAEHRRDAERAAAIYRLLLPMDGRNVVLAFTGWLGPAAHFLGLAAAGGGRLDDAAGHLESAITACVRAGARPNLARSQATLARILLERDRPGDRDRAAGLVRDSRELAVGLGMASIVTVAESLARRIA